MMRGVQIAVAFASGAVLFAATIALAQIPRRSAGEAAFQRCYSCHSLVAAESGLTGPNLDRIVGRRIAAAPGFAYSAAFREFAGREKVWTRDLLDRFIADPDTVVPGNDMQYFGLRDAGERSALVAFIADDR